MKSRGMSAIFSVVVLSALLHAAPARAAGPGVSILKVDEATVSGTLAGLDDGKLLLTSPDVKIPLEDLVSLIPKGNGAPVIAVVRKLSGKVIGTDGSYQEEGNTKDHVFDGDLNTFFDAPEMSGGWVGLDLGSPKIITQIKYAPRPGQELYQSRMQSGQFEGSNSPDFSGAPTVFGTVNDLPPVRKLSELKIEAPQPFRYVRYRSPANSNCNIAEMEVWGKDPGLPTASRASGKPATSRAASTSPAIVVASVRIILGNDEPFTGPLLGWSEKQLRVGTPYGEGGGLDIPIEMLHELWKGTAEQLKQARAIVLEPGPEDAAFVLKDNAVIVVRGVALGIAGDSLRFKFNADERKINLTKLIGVILGGNDAKRDGSLRQTFQLRNGDSITGLWKGFDATTGTIGLQTAWGPSLDVPFADVIRVVSTNGRLTYLSDLKPVAVEQTPYFDRMLTYRVDKSLIGGPLKLSDGEYAHGIAVHSRTVLTYDIAGTHEEFKTKVGFQQPEGKLGQAVVRVLGDGKVLYENPDARGDAKPVDVSVKVSGVQRLILEVDFGKNEDTGDRVVWANARLLRAKK